MTQCDSQTKKSKPINFYAGIFDNKSFRRGSRGIRVDCSPGSDRILHNGLARNGTPPNNRAEDKVGVIHATLSSEGDESAATIHWQLDDGPEISQGNAGNLFDLRHRPLDGDAKPKIIRNPGSPETHERMQFDADAGKRGLESCTGSERGHSMVRHGNVNQKRQETKITSFGLPETYELMHFKADARKGDLESCTGSGRRHSMIRQRNVNQKRQETKITSFDRSSERSGTKDLQGNEPGFINECPSQRDDSSLETTEPASANLHDFSALPGKQWGMSAAKQVSNHRKNANSLSQSIGTASRSTVAPEGLVPSTTSSRTEFCWSESSLCPTADAKAHTPIADDAEAPPSSFSSTTSAVGPVATEAELGYQCNSDSEELRLRQQNSRRQTITSRELVSCSKDEFPVATRNLDSEVNGRFEEERPKLKAFSSHRIHSSDNQGLICGAINQQEPFYRVDANGLVLEVSPTRGRSVLASPTRIGDIICFDSSSSLGGSSSSGSPLALEILKEGGLPSPGDFINGKSSGSPFASVSSGSTGSITGCDNPLNCRRSPTSSKSNPEGIWLSISKRSDENVLSSVPHSNYDLKMGGSSQRTLHGITRSVTNTSYPNRGCQSTNSRGPATILQLGSLLVGGANGDVLSCGGVPSGNSGQHNTREGSKGLECMFLKRVSSTSDLKDIKNAAKYYYKAGHFSEALALCDRAVNLCPSDVVHRCNRATALSALERLGEAAKECEEAIRLDSCCMQARQHAASLYIRLGMIENARQHFHDAGQQANLMAVQQMQKIEKHLFQCIKSRNLGDWLSVIQESDAAVVAGADAAPQIFGFKAEALLRMQKLHQAEMVCKVAQKIETSLIASFIGSPTAYLLIIRSQVNMALGRFDEAVLAAEAAVKVEPHNASAVMLLEKARAVAHARATGNDFFNRGSFFEALTAYAEGLEIDATNAVLLCNRAACRLKLGQWEKAMEDCDAALESQPTYTKARLRRASCLAQLERWEDALQDYEAVKKELPGNAIINRALFDVQLAMKKSRGEEIRGMKFGGDVEEVTNEEQFRDAIGSAGLMVVQFVTRWSHRCQELSPFMDDLCRRNPCVNFVKVYVEELPHLGRMESITFIPTFKIYKDGQKLKEEAGPSQQWLEWALEHFSL